MNCTQCGSPLSEGSLFCQACGSPVKEQPAPAAQTPPPVPPAQPVYQQPLQTPYQPYGASPQTPAQPYGISPYAPAPQYKKRTKLVVSLIAIGIVFIAAAVCLYLLAVSGTPVTGQWYCEERGQVLVFNNDNTLTGYALTGTVDANYTYDKGKGEGTATANGSDLAFKVNKDELVLINEEADDECTFVKVDNNSDKEELVLSALQGLWSSDEIGEVLEFKDGKIKTNSGAGEFEGTYDYDIDKGKGSFTINGKEFNYAADYNMLSVSDIGDYVKAEKKLDIDAFVAEHAMPIAGMWYDASGTYGTIEFYTDGTAQIVMLDMTVAATYTFDVATGTGSLTCEAAGQTSEMILKDGLIEIDGITYTRDVVEQASANATSSVIGTWYETAGTLGSVTFYDDGSLAVGNNGVFIYGTYTFNLIDGSGQIELEEEGTTNTYAFNCDGITLQIGDFCYTREVVEPVSAGITGIWCDLGGSSSTLSFYDGSSVYMVNPDGVELNGSYIFDDATGLGSMTVSDGASSVTYDISLNQGILTVNGLQYAFDNTDDGL